MQIGVLGGTGPAGSGLAVRLASVGFDVVVGSRSKYRAMEVADKLLNKWPDRALSIEAGDNHTASSAEVVFVATPWDAAASTVKECERELKGKVVISMANALARVGHEFQPLVPPRGSVAASVQAAVPRSLVAASMHHVPAAELGDIAQAAPYLEMGVQHFCIGWDVRILHDWWRANGAGMRAILQGGADEGGRASPRQAGGGY